jgi:predicted transport protein
MDVYTVNSQFTDYWAKYICFKTWKVIVSIVNKAKGGKIILCIEIKKKKWFSEKYM